MASKQQIEFHQNRQAEIHAKGFNMGYHYKAEKINGIQKIDKANVNLRTIVSRVDDYYTDKTAIIEALTNHDYETLRAASEFYFDYNGIYKRACEYLAYLFRYDYYLIPYVNDNNLKNEKALEEFGKLSSFLDNSNLKRRFNEIALEVVKKGCYYGYRVDDVERLIIQDFSVDQQLNLI